MRGGIYGNGITFLVPDRSGIYIGLSRNISQFDYSHLRPFSHTISSDTTTKFLSLSTPSTENSNLHHHLLSTTLTTTSVRSIDLSILAFHPFGSSYEKEPVHAIFFMPKTSIWDCFAKVRGYSRREESWGCEGKRTIEVTVMGEGGWRGCAGGIASAEVARSRMREPTRSGFIDYMSLIFLGNESIKSVGWLLKYRWIVW